MGTYNLGGLICRVKIYFHAKSTDTPSEKMGDGAYLDGAGSNVAVMGHAGGERGAIVESEGGLVFGKLELLLESVDIFPVLEDFLLLVGEIGPLGHYKPLRLAMSQKEEVQALCRLRDTYLLRIWNSCGSL